ncbi:hypothetical protein [Ruegeria sp.]|uniref:hypothetical protein n=1 Tax=Ruegeria sp. TaxID=1879320 RepID=UPI003C7EB810
MKKTLMRSKNRLVIGALMCSTALVMPSLTLAETFLIDEELRDQLLQSELTNLQSGDTVIIGENTRIETLDEEGIDFWRVGIDDLTIINNGTIHTTGTYVTNWPNEPDFDPDDEDTWPDSDETWGDGIFVTGNVDGGNTGLYVLNNGVISVGDGQSSGYYIENFADSTFVNKGLIYIRSEAAEDFVDNGQLGLTASFSAGIRVNAYQSFVDIDDNVIGAEARPGNLLVNNRTIVSEVLQSRGMYIDGATGNFWLSVDSTAINNGTIRMLAETDLRPAPGTFDVSGLRGEGHDISLVNNGLIEINPEGFGIDINGVNGSILNNGTILSYGDNSHGIEHYRNGNTIPEDLELSYTENTGLISVEGLNSHGVSLTGYVGHVFVNSSSVFSQNGYSIDVRNGGPQHETGDRNIIRLQEGSLLFGNVFVDEASSEYTSMDFGDGLNATVRFEEDAHIGDGREAGLPAEFTSYHNSHYFDPETNAVYVADLDSYAQQDQAFFNMTQMLQDAVEAGNSVETPENSFAFAANEEGVWTRAFGGGLFADADGSMPGYDAYSFGVVTGKSSNSKGYFGGIAYTTVSGDEDVSYETDSFTVYGGMAGSLSSKLDYSLIAGVTHNHTDRDVADNQVSGGIDTTGSDYASVFISPALTHVGPIKGSSVRLRYVGLWQESHDFNWDGGTELSVDSRFSNLMETRVQMEHNVGAGKIAYGLDAIWSDGNDMSFELMGAALTSPYEDGFSSRAFARYDSKFGYLEVGYDSDDRTTFDLGLKVSF